MGFGRRLAALAVAVVAAASIAACGSTRSESASTSSGALDGNSYHVAMRSQGGRPMDDDLIFKDGRMESTLCTNVGFERAPYRCEQTGSGTAVACGCDSASMGHNDWRATVTGDHIEGTCTRTPKGGGEPIRMTFSGERLGR